VDSQSYEFDIALSFAGPEREYARAIYEILTASDVRVFLDEVLEAEIWGKNLPEYLTDVYSRSAQYCLMLISKDYVARAYTRVERRAAFDRMLESVGEYVLPVRVDDSWIDGLPKATAYLDLRTSGVLGVTEAALRKVRGDASHHVLIPEDLHIPRIPLGRLRSADLERYLLELCNRRKIAMFGALIYDEGTAEMRKLLQDKDYWDALDSASGPDFEVFAIRDEVREVLEDPEYHVELMTMMSAPRTVSRKQYHSRLLSEYFGKSKSLIAYPSLLLFIVSNGRIQVSRLIPLQRGSRLSRALWKLKWWSPA
jgi:hypothetical protein